MRVTGGTAAKLLRLFVRIHGQFEIKKAEENIMSETKKLTRSSTDKRVAGVCSGLAEYFGVDATLVRLIFVVATLFGGPGLILYIVLWIIMPEA